MISVSSSQTALCWYIYLHPIKITDENSRDDVAQWVKLALGMPALHIGVPS